MDGSLISTSSGSCNVRSPLRKERRLDASLDAHALCVLQEQLRTPSQADDSHFGRSSIIDENSVVSDSFNEVDLLRARMRADRAAAKAAQSEVQYLEAQRAESLRGSGSERSRSTKGGKPPSSTTTGGHTDPNPPLMRGDNAMLMGESHTHEAKALIVHSADRKDGIMPQYFALDQEHSVLRHEHLLLHQQRELMQQAYSIVEHEAAQVAVSEVARQRRTESDVDELRECGEVLRSQYLNLEVERARAQEELECKLRSDLSLVNELEEVNRLQAAEDRDRGN